MPPSNRWNDPDVYDISRYLFAEPEREFEPSLWLYFNSLPASALQLLCSLLPDYQLVPRATKTAEPEQPVFERKITFDSETLFLRMQPCCRATLDGHRQALAPRSALPRAPPRFNQLLGQPLNLPLE